MRCYWLAVVALFLGAHEPSTAQEGRADFKGARLGMSVDEWRSVNEGHFNRRYQCSAPSGGPMHGDLQCSLQFGQSETIAEVPVRHAIFSWYGTELGRIVISFAPEHFSQVASAMVAKYGTPADEKRSVVQNRLGASFENVEMQWRVNGDTVELKRFFGSLSTSGVTYASAAALAEAQRRERLRADKAKKDL